QAVPRFGAGGHVAEREADPGQDLQQEQDEGDAAEDVEPARRRARHPMAHHVADGGRQLQSPIEPATDGAEPLHYVDSASVGSRPARMYKLPCSTLYWCSNRPRGGGPAARAPSS